MHSTFSGKIVYANGAPVANVEVRIFDRDSAGAGDDDLTISVGRSDENGQFTLLFEPSRYLDVNAIEAASIPNEPFNLSAPMPEPEFIDAFDTYLPYLQFKYELKGTARLHTAKLSPFKKEFRLPENSPTDFLPSINGFKFINAFPGYFLPISVPSFAGSKKVPAIYGLCGGMSSAAYDLVLANRKPPLNIDVPNRGTQLHQYLYRRQIDSFGALGGTIVKVAQWTTLPTDTPVGTQKRTLDEFESIRTRLEDQTLVVLGLIYSFASSVAELAKLIFENHQVLAYSYAQSDVDHFRLRIYDPNFPMRDDEVIQMQRVQVGEISRPEGVTPIFGFRSVQTGAAHFDKPVRGFFAMPYSPVTPPPNI